MKKATYLLIVLLLLLCSCSQKKQSEQTNEQTNHLNIGSFSYSDDFTYYKNEPGVKQSGFVNTEKTEVSDALQAIKLAIKECTVGYDTIDVAFDASLKIYRVCFYKEGWFGGNQDVYINQEGITQLIIYGE